MGRTTPTLGQKLPKSKQGRSPVTPGNGNGVEREMWRWNSGIVSLSKLQMEVREGGREGKREGRGRGGEGQGKMERDRGGRKEEVGRGDRKGEGERKRGKRCEG